MAYYSSPHASKLRPNYSKRNAVVQPQYTRVRHFFRSPRESEKVNLASEQLAFDIASMMARTELLNDRIEANLDIVEAGGNANAPYTFVIPSLDDLIVKVQELITRLDRIETREEL